MAINKVLIVDDSETELVNLKTIVSSAGAVALLARSGKDPDTADIPVVFVSNKNQKADRLWAAKQGGEDLISKPYTPDQIVEKLKTF